MRLGTLLRLAVSLALLGVLLWRFSPQDLADAFTGADPTRIALAGLVMVAIQLLLIAKWWLLARSRAVRLSPLVATRLYLQASLLNYVLPTGIGGDAYRIYRGREHAEGGLSDATASVLFDRGTGYLGMAALAAVGAAFYFGGPAAGLPVLIATTAFGVLGVVMAPALGRLHITRATGFLPGKSDVRPLLEATLLAVAIHVLYVMAVMLIGDAFDLGVPWSYWAVVNLLTAMAIIVPISIGGLGVREGGFVGLLHPLDVPAAKATSASLTVAFLLGAVSLALLALLELVELLRWLGRSSDRERAKAEPAPAESPAPQ